MSQTWSELHGHRSPRCLANLDSFELSISALLPMDFVRILVAVYICRLGKYLDKPIWLSCFKARKVITRRMWGFGNGDVLDAARSGCRIEGSCLWTQTMTLTPLRIDRLKKL